MTPADYAALILGAVAIVATGAALWVAVALFVAGLLDALRGLMERR